MKIPEIGESMMLKDAEATIEAGCILAMELGPGAIIALSGPLGAGKTHFTQGIAKGLGIDDSVSSPTFGLVHEYQSGRLPLFHFDLYRTESQEEVEAIGWDEYLESDGIIVAEWAERFPDLFPAETVWLRLDYSEASERRVLAREKG